MEVQRSWSEPNSAYYKDKKEEFEKAITEMEWKLVTSEMQLPLSTGFAIKEFVNKLQLPRVSHIALSNDFAPYGFYGLRTHYGDGQVEIYILDTGLAGAVICSDKHPMPVDKETLIKKWIEIGQRYADIDGTMNNPLGRDFFYECITIEELVSRMEKTDWVKGQAYFYKNLCFIFEICVQNDWLVIRDELPFDSINIMHIAKDQQGQNRTLPELIEAILEATPEQLKNLSY